MLRPLERYDPSKGYLDSELEVGNTKTTQQCQRSKHAGQKDASS